MADRVAMRDRIHDIISTVSAIKTVAPRVPSAVQRVELPMAFARDAGSRVVAVLSDPNGYRMATTWQITVMVAEVGMGLRAENEDSAYDIADAVYEAFAQHPLLALPSTAKKLDTVKRASIVSDSGLRAPIAYPDGQAVREFYGYQFVLEVEHECYC